MTEGVGQHTHFALFCMLDAEVRVQNLAHDKSGTAHFAAVLHCCLIPFELLRV